MLSSAEQKDYPTCAVKLTLEDKNLLEKVSLQIRKVTGYRKPDYQIVGEALRLHPMAQALSAGKGEG